MKCRACGHPLTRTFLDLGKMPLANSYLSSPDEPEAVFPLHARVCDSCTLVQADEHATPETLFTDYAFLSGYSLPWVEHCRDFAKEMEERFAPRTVLEVASNDGTLLEQFAGCNVLGVDPARNVAEIANRKGIPTVTAFFTEDLARTILPADLVVANNVFGHVPDPKGFARALRAAVHADGVVSIETPWLGALVERGEFDTIYHEHFNYWTFHALEMLLRTNGLGVFDVEHLDVHGGSLRLLCCPPEHARYSTHGNTAVHRLRCDEYEAGMWMPGSVFFTGFAPRVERIINDVRLFLAGCEDRGEMVCAAGAAAKGNTLLNAAGVTRQQIQMVSDTSPHKQGKYLPGSHVPVVAPDVLREYRPDFVLILAWNWAAEIMGSLGFVREWGGRFVVPIPELVIV